VVDTHRGDDFFSKEYSTPGLRSSHLARGRGWMSDVAATEFGIIPEDNS
jgi:hypothetical protein